MSTARIQIDARVADMQLRVDLVGSGDARLLYDPTPNAAIASTGWTQSGDYAGTAEVATDHGIQTGDKVDLYWTGGRCTNMEATVTPGLYSDEIALAGPVSPEDGASLVPTGADTQVYLCKHNTMSWEILADLLVFLAISVAARCILRFVDDQGAVQVLEFEPPSGQSAYRGGTAWSGAAGDGTCPLEGDIVSATITTISTSNVATIKVAGLYAA